MMRTELTVDQMEQVNGGSHGRGVPVYINEKDSKLRQWEKENIQPFFEDTGRAFVNIGKGAYNWVTGLFSSDD